MLGLLDLPVDVLRRIVQQLEPIKRNHVDTIEISPGQKLPVHLWTCRQWCSIALQVYYDQLSRSGNTALYLAANHLATIPPPNTPAIHFLCKNLHRVSVRLQGQPSHEVAMEPFFNNGNHDGQDQDEVTEDDSTDGDTYSESPVMTQMAASFNQTKRQKAKSLSQTQWQKEMADGLDTLSQTISRCSALKEISFQAFHGFDEDPAPQWNYLYYSIAKRFMQSMLAGLTHLSLDLAGTDLVPSNGSKTKHLCPAIRDCIFGVKHVRLRLRHICPSIFGVQDIQYLRRQAGVAQPSKKRGKKKQSNQEAPMTTESSTAPPVSPTYSKSDEIRLKSLTIRLSLPWFEQESDKSILFDAEQCPECAPLPNGQLGLHNYLSLCAHCFQQKHSSIDNIKISYRHREPGQLGTDCYAIDCIKWETIFSNVPCYEDDGETWEDWENNKEKRWENVDGSDLELEEERVSEPLMDPKEMLDLAMQPKKALPREWLPPPWKLRNEDDWEDEEDDSAEEGLAAGGWDGDMSPTRLGIGDLLDLEMHDMIFGEDHTPF
ncbi:uncharacterized protein KY384_008058 [Bacidia gigantensis]|uniref:uncharacterized protein n=1 Tax=Bacidia gigantensis TaxID=2732470 RepID=UPI001D03BA10|nr:uncharacterized protein KY384_008058 [Bacidia gigantensis]KAG8527314.1 hypothetical protein KY384_008058 [Bacidia gigantensis]